MIDLCTVLADPCSQNVNSMHIISTLRERRSTALEFVKLQQLAYSYVQTLLYNRHKTTILTSYLYNMQTELIFVNKDVKGKEPTAENPVIQWISQINKDKERSGELDPSRDM